MDLGASPRSLVSGSELVHIYRINRDRALDLVGRIKDKFPRMVGQYFTPLLHAAIASKDSRLVKYMIECGASTGIYCGRAALAEAIIHADQGEASEILSLLLGQTSHLDSVVLRDTRSSTSKVANIRILDAVEYMETPLLVAIGTKRESVVRLILERGADVNERPIGVTRTPLQKAAEVGSFTLTKLLISLGANVNASALGRWGATAVQFAARGGYAGIVALLSEEHANVTAPSGYFRRTAIKTAAVNGRIDTVRLLLNTGKFDDQPGVGQVQDALSRAKKNGHQEVVDQLRRHLENLQPPEGHTETFSEEAGSRRIMTELEL